MNKMLQNETPFPLETIKDLCRTVCQTGIEVTTTSKIVSAVDDHFTKIVSSRWQKSFFRIYRTKNIPKSENNYDNSPQLKLFFQLKVVDLPLRWETYHLGRLGHGKTWLGCRGYVEKTFKHFLFECQSLPNDPDILT